MRRLINLKRRRGANTVQVAFVLVVIAVAVIASVNSLGTRTSSEMLDTAGRVGDPSTLPARFSTDYSSAHGSGGSGQADSDGYAGGSN
ncbi:MAG: hypothetical protein OES79_06060 [Planctomycetota bacterium]|nr:hypothetical protein [Planctomycetota bacterium]